MPQSTRLECHLHLLQGRNPSIKDRTSSDPFVRIYLDDGTKASRSSTFDGEGADCLYQSRSKSKTVDPKWNEHFRHTISDPAVVERLVGGQGHLVLSLFDDDGMHGEDAMGRVRIPVQVVAAASKDEMVATWYPVSEGGQGEVQAKLQVVAVHG